MKRLSLGFSPCPNDTFIFHALVHGLVDLPGIELEPRLEDVETLNRLALEKRLDVTKISYGALPYLLDEYVLLRSGGALGRGCGPLIVAKREMDPADLRSARIAIPGKLTTANLLLRLFQPDAPSGLELSYDRILPAVAAGEVDAGLIIHESRFTYPDHGLVKVVDLGEWWETDTGSPIPLGAIVARRDLGEQAHKIEQAIRKSVEAAYADPGASGGYVQQHSQEISPSVTQNHIDLYVNSYSVDLGDEGLRAVRELLRRAENAGLLAQTGVDHLRSFSTI